MLDVRLLVKDLDEIEVAVIRLLQLVQRKLEVYLFLFLKVISWYMGVISIQSEVSLLVLTNSGPVLRSGASSPPRG